MPYAISASSSAIAFPTDHVDHAEDGNDVGDHVAAHHLGQRPHAEEARRAHAAAIGPPAAVADHVEAELAVAALDCLVDLAARHLGALHDELEMVHQAFDAVVH